MSNNTRSHVIRVNMICNESCSFCNVTTETEPNYKEKSIFDILRSVQKIIKQEGGPENVKITLSGGEPTLRKDLDSIVLGIRKLGIRYIELQTNASLLNPDQALRLINNGVNRFFISFHSHQKVIFEEYVGLKGIFDIVVDNIKNLGGQSDTEVILNPVISHQNYKNLREYFDFLRNSFPFVTYISLSFIQPHGGGKTHMELMLDYETINAKLHGILEYAHGLGFVLNNPYCGLPVCVLGWDKYNSSCIEVVEGKAIIEAGGSRNDPNKVYLKKCNGCIYKGLCGGVWKEYAEVYGDRGITSITSF